MNRTDKILTALVHCELAGSALALKEAREELRMAYLDYEESRKNPEAMIMELLQELDAPDHLVGLPYVVHGALLLTDDPSLINRMTGEFYPAIAEKFGTTASKAERGIRKVVEKIWLRCSWETLNKYFGNIVSPDKGKPCNGEFMARLANIIRLEQLK